MRKGGDDVDGGRKKTTDKTKVSIMSWYMEVFPTMPIRWEQVK